MGTEGSIRKVKGTKVLLSEAARRAQETPHWMSWRRQANTARTTRNGWSAFENAPKVDEFDAIVQILRGADALTPPRRNGRPGGASIHVPEGEWSVEEQLGEERGREL